MSTPNVKIHELLDFVRQGRIMDAMRKFYDDECVMEEPAYGKTVGLAANLEREQQFVESIQEVTLFEAKPGVGDNISFYENIMDWTTKENQKVHVEQVAVQHWRDGKIIYERFYYNT